MVSERRCAAARFLPLNLASNRYDQRGRLRTARLMDEHGPSMPMPELLEILSVTTRGGRP
jgi:hypothetical protein